MIMKKKIRDFSLDEILKTCGNRDCDNCPLKDTMICVCEIEWKEDQLDQEIEVKDGK